MSAWFNDRGKFLFKNLRILHFFKQELAAYYCIMSFYRMKPPILSCRKDYVANLTLSFPLLFMNNEVRIYDCMLQLGNIFNFLNNILVFS